MISDVLSDAILQMRGYLEHSATRGCYTGEIRARIIALGNEMEAVRVILDTPPTNSTSKEQS
jgi:hypothetical protein